MKVFVTGVHGQLGYDVIQELKNRGISFIGSDLADTSDEISPYVPLDITDRNAVEAVLLGICPDAVIHCAAWTAVDLAEDNEERVRAINVGGTENIALACKKIGAKMVYLSTDYVFDGSGTAPWLSDSTTFAPLNVYGKSKLDGEFAVKHNLDKYFIVRTAWVFGKNGNNFVKAMLNLGQTHETVRVVCDQIGTPTYTPDLSRLLVDMILTEKYGSYHATNEGGFISWYEFAKVIFRRAGYQTKVISVTTEEYGISKAQRPRNSRLDKSKLLFSGFALLPPWQDALKRYMEGR